MLSQKRLYWLVAWLVLFVIFQVGLKVRQANLAKIPKVVEQTSQTWPLLKAQDLENVIQNHPLTVLSFWETWCEPCHEEMPILEEYFSEIDEVAVVGVFLSSDHQEVSSFMNRYNLGMMQFKDEDHRLHNLYEVQGYPTTLVINNNQEKIYSSIGFRNTPGQPHAVDKMKDFIKAHLEENHD